MRIAGIIKNSVVNGVGIRDVIFTQGCVHKCKECHNPETWDFNGGVEYGVLKLYHLFENSNNNLTISGGEPMFQLVELLQLLRIFHRNTNKTVWIYTGYEFSDISFETWEMLANLNVEVVVDGKFEVDKKDLTLEFRGSSNQRIIDLKKTVEYGEVILWENSMK